MYIFEWRSNIKKKFVIVLFAFKTNAFFTVLQSPKNCDKNRLKFKKVERFLAFPIILKNQKKKLVSVGDKHSPICGGSIIA